MRSSLSDPKHQKLQADHGRIGIADLAVEDGLLLAG
jgi:hypothetical protein